MKEWKNESEVQIISPDHLKDLTQGSGPQMTTSS